MNEKRTIKKRQPGIWVMLKNNLGIIIGLLVICIAATIIKGDAFFSVKNLFNVLRQLSANMYLACGMTLVIILGGIDLSVGSTIAMTGCLAAGFITNNGMPAMMGILLAMIIGTSVGAFNGFVVSTTTIPAFIVTLATMNIGRGVARVYTDTKTITVSNEFFNKIAAGYVGPIPIQVFYIVAVVALTAFILNRTQLGRHIFAVGGNMQAAKFSGVNTKGVVFFVFVFCSFLASFAGIMWASRLFSGAHTAGEGAEMDAIAAVVLGGTSMSGGSGAISGTVIGVLIIAVLNNMMNLMGINASWQYIVKGVVILIAVYIDYFKKRNEK